MVPLIITHPTKKSPHMGMSIEKYKRYSLECNNEDILGD